VGALVSALLENVEWWADPTYAMFWIYFVLTLFGGVSLLLLTTFRPWRTCLRSEPEWLAYIVPMLAVTALVVDTPATAAATLWPVWPMYLLIAMASFAGLWMVRRWAAKAPPSPAPVLHLS
jgi:hypothetical protein